MTNSMGTTTTRVGTDTPSYDSTDEGYMGNESMPLSDGSLYTLSMPCTPTTPHTESTTTVTSSRGNSFDHNGPDMAISKQAMESSERFSRVNWFPFNPEAPAFTPRKGTMDVSPRTKDDERSLSLFNSQIPIKPSRDGHLVTSTELSIKDLHTNGQHNSTGRIADLIYLDRAPKGGSQPDTHDDQPKQDEEPRQKDSWSGSEELELVSQRRRYSWSSASTRVEQSPRTEQTESPQSMRSQRTLPEDHSSYYIHEEDRVSLTSSVLAEINYTSNIGPNPSIELPAIDQISEPGIERADHGASLSPMQPVQDDPKSRSIRIQEPDTEHPRSGRSIYGDEQQQKQKRSRAFRRAYQGCGDALVSFFECYGMICCALRTICCDRI